MISYIFFHCFLFFVIPALGFTYKFKLSILEHVLEFNYLTRSILQVIKYTVSC